MKAIRSIYILFIGLFVASCGPQPMFEKSYDFSDHSWGAGESPMFEIVANDTNNHYNFIVVLRTTQDYEYSNIWVFMHTKNPNGEQRKDTLNFPLADPSGKWLGKKTGTVVEHELLIGWNKKFPLLGNYQIRFEQAVPDPELEHVLDLTLRIVPSENNNP